MSDTNFIFSIVVAVYNTENYLVEAIDSIINQSFDFKKIQIVLVDDGSTDKSTEICLYYKKKYPDNIYYLYQENAGQSIARNNGMNIASGKYINFLDSDDKLDLNALEDVYNLFKKFDDIIDVVTIPRYNFDAVNGPMFLNYRYSPTRIVDIYEEYDFPQVATNAAFIRKDALTDRFDPRVIISEDSLLINKTILKKCRYGVVSTANYMYRKRIEQTSTLDTKKARKEYYIDRMEFYFKELINYSISKFGHVLRYIQTVLMYDIQWFFLDNTHGILTEKELSQFYSLMQEVLQFIDDDIILSQRFLTPILEHHIINLKHGNPNFEIICNSNELLLGYDNKLFDNITNHKVVITQIYNINDLLYVKGFFDTYFGGIHLNAYLNNVNLDLFEIDGDEVYAINHKISNRFHFATILELDSGNNEISFNISVDSHEYPINLQDESYNYKVTINNNKLIFNNNFEDSINKSIKSKIYQTINTLKDNNQKLDVYSFEHEILGMNASPKVSVILSVYNPGKLLYRCLDSVVNQTLKEIEVICVDEGSSDNSLEILHEYVKKDSRFKIYHQKNLDVWAAKNNALGKSKGEFILFLDADDWIEQNMCKKLYEHAIQLNSDVVIFDSLLYTKDNKNILSSYFPDNEFTENYQAFTFDYHFIKNKLMLGNLGALWSKFYNSSFIKDNEIQFTKHKIYNDVEFHFKSILLAKNISYIPETFYHHTSLDYPSSKTSFHNKKDELIWVEVLNEIYCVLIENNLMNELRLDFINYCIYYSFDKLKNINPEYQNIFLNELKSFFKKVNPQQEELNSLKTSNLNWYNHITTKYLFLYNDLINNDVQSLKLHLFEFKIYDAKTTLKNTPKESKEEVYEDLRKMFINFDENICPINKLSTDLHKFYISVINFETYSSFKLFNEEITKDYWHKIDKRKLSFEIDNFNEIGLNLEERTNKIIVSLTSFPERIPDIHFCIYSLLTQDFKPDIVVLWLAEEQFPNKEADLSDELLKLKNNGLTIKWCHDIKPYKKLIPSLKEFPNDYIVTVDDDIFYHKYWLKDIWNQYTKSPNTIVASRARRLNFDSDGLIDRYDKWHIIKEKNESSFLNFPTGAGGILYFPNALCEQIFDETLFLELCPSGDDIWFWAMAVLNKTKISVIETPIDSLTYINVARESGILNDFTLWNLNKDGMNDIQMGNVISNFPKILDIIKNE